MAGGRGLRERDVLTDILVYDGNEDKWTKVGDLCNARWSHAISLVPADVEDECIVDIDCF